MAAQQAERARKEVVRVTSGELNMDQITQGTSGPVKELDFIMRAMRCQGVVLFRGNRMIGLDLHVRRITLARKWKPKPYKNSRLVIQALFFFWFSFSL